GAEDLDKLTALSSLVSTLVQKVNTQDSELKAHKLLFKEVVGKLVQKVKVLDDKLKGRKRKFMMTDSDKEEDAEQDVDPLITLAKAAATAAAASTAAASAAAASAVPTSGSHEANIPPSSSIPSDKFADGSDVPAGATTGPSVDPSNKGKSPLVEEDPPVRERTFRKREEDRLGEEAARRMYEEEQDELEREREEMQRKRQQDHVKSFSDDQLKTEFDKIRTAAAELQSLNIRRSLKRPGADLEQASSKKSKPTEAPKSSVPDESQQPSAIGSTYRLLINIMNFFTTYLLFHLLSHHSYGTRRKSLGARKKSSTELDLTANDRSFIRVLSDESDDSNDDDDTPILWHAFAAWEVVPTRLGDVNVLYFSDKSSKYFTHLREILHLNDRKDLFKLYGMVVLVLVFGQINNSGLSGVGDTPYPLLAQLMKRMLKHKLEVEIDGIGNDLTYAEQLIQFIKNQVAASTPSA
ncbi:hypothetical protein Tco_1084898, partial [Tanacetum coccineum]